MIQFRGGIFLMLEWRELSPRGSVLRVPCSSSFPLTLASKLGPALLAISPSGVDHNDLVLVTVGLGLNAGKYVALWA